MNSFAAGFAALSVFSRVVRGGSGRTLLAGLAVCGAMVPGMAGAWETPAPGIFLGGKVDFRVTADGEVHSLRVNGNLVAAAAGRVRNGRFVFEREVGNEHYLIRGFFRDSQQCTGDIVVLRANEPSIYREEVRGWKSRHEDASKDPEPGRYVGDDIGFEVSPMRTISNVSYHGISALARRPLKRVSPAPRVINMEFEYRAEGDGVRIHVKGKWVTFTRAEGTLEGAVLSPFGSVDYTFHKNWTVDLKE